MNSKDAFRAQNKLQSLMDETGDILQDRDNTLKVTTTHLRSRVMPEAHDTAADYTLFFEMNDSFGVILSDFIQRQTA